MDKWQAIYSFWNSFGLPVYDENKVPPEATVPYITYESAVGTFGNVLSLIASIWDRGNSYEKLDLMADNIAKYIRTMDCPEIDGGRYRVFIGESKYAIHMDDPEDDQLVRVRLNVNFEFMTDY